MTGLAPKFEYKISLGQNFLFDTALLKRLVDASGVGQGDRVLEIGAGRGDLTQALADRVDQVTAVEIDERLIPILESRFAESRNVSIIMADIMKLDMAEIMGPGAAFHVVANLPYYLTTPILALLLKSALPIQSISVMVQEEAAQRLLAQPGTPVYGPLALLASYRGIPRKSVRVPAAMFTPPPKVDSVFVTLPYHVGERERPQDEALFFRLINAAFAMRRKTLVNNLMPAFSLSRDVAIQCIREAGLPESVRGERLTLADFFALSRILADKKTN